MAQETKITMDLVGDYIDDALIFVSGEVDFNFITDVYLSELPYLPAKVIDVPFSELILYLSKRYDRYFVNSGGDYIFQKNDSYMQNFKDVANIESGKIAWKGIGELRELPHQNRKSKDFPRLKNPSVVNIFAKRVPVSKLVQEISRQTGWLVEIEYGLQNRRVSALLKDVKVEKAIEMLALLLDCRQNVRLNRSSDQKKWETEKLADALDDRPNRIKESDKLVPELLNVLSDSQKAMFSQGKEVAISLKNLPNGLRDKCKDYLTNTMKDLQSRSSISFDLSRIDEFSIVLLPLPSRALGGDGFTIDGGKIHF